MTNSFVDILLAVSMLFSFLFLVSQDETFRSVFIQAVLVGILLLGVLILAYCAWILPPLIVGIYSG